MTDDRLPAELIAVAVTLGLAGQSPTLPPMTHPMAVAVANAAVRALIFAVHRVAQETGLAPADIWSEACIGLARRIT